MRAALLLCLGLWAAPAQAEEPVLEVQWDALAAAGGLLTGKVLPGVPGGALRIEADAEGPHNIVVWSLDKPPLSSKRWRLEGQVRHLNVAGEGHLILMSTLDGRDYLTKTVAPTGPLGRLSGHSDWRPFVLPFDAGDRPTPPDKLTLQLFLSGEGTVDIGSLRLYPSFDDALVADLGPRLGWNQATFGLAAGLLGSLFGLLGGVLGLLNASRKAPTLVWIIQKGAMALGVVAMGLGIAAIASGEAGGWLISVGLIGVVVFALVGRTIRTTLPPT